MIYNLLKRIQNLLASKPSGTKEEQEILSLVSQALPAMLNGHDTETLAANELLVRICPDTKRPVLVCHNVPVPAQWDDGRGCRRRGLMAAFQR